MLSFHIIIVSIKLQETYSLLIHIENKLFKKS